MKPRSEFRFDPRDWRRAPFDRWTLEGVPLEPPADGFAAVVQDFISTPEWETRFRQPLQALRQEARAHFETRIAELENRKPALQQETSDRLAAIDVQKAAALERERQAAAPLALTPRQDAFQLSAKVVAEKTSVGIPGLRVRLLQPKQPQHVLAETTTSADGDAVLTLTKEQVEKHAPGEVTAEVQLPSGKALLRTDRAVRPVVGEVQSWISHLPVRDDIKGELQPLVDAGQGFKKARTDRLAQLTGKVEEVKAAHGRRLKDVQDRIDELQEVVDAIRRDDARDENE